MLHFVRAHAKSIAICGALIFIALLFIAPKVLAAIVAVTLSTVVLAAYILCALAPLIFQLDIPHKEEV